MNAIILLVLLAALFLSLFLIIPKYAPASQVDIIQDWVGMGFNGLLFLIVLYETKLKYGSVYQGIGFFLIALTIALSGVYWWIPKYVKKEKQSEAIKIMFNVLSASILLTNIMTKAVPVTLPRFNDMGGGRRR